MLLVVDVGNTQTHFGVFGDDDGVLAEHWRFATVRESTRDELGAREESDAAVVERALNAYLLGRLLDATQAKSSLSEEDAEKLAVEEVRSDVPIQLGSSGFELLFVPLANLKAVRRARRPSGLGANVYVFAMSGERSGSQVHGRMFDQSGGEDPATGGAQGPLGAYIVPTVEMELANGDVISVRTSTDEQAHAEARQYAAAGGERVGGGPIAQTRIGWGSHSRGMGADSERADNKARGQTIAEAARSYEFNIDNGLTLVGSPETVILLCSYFFDGATHLNDIYTCGTDKAK